MFVSMFFMVILTHSWFNVISHIVFSQNASCRGLYSYWKHKNSWLNKKGGSELYYIRISINKCRRYDGNRKSQCNNSNGCRQASAMNAKISGQMYDEK